VRSPLALVAGGAVLTMALTACAGSEQGTPVPTSDAPTTTTAAVPTTTTTTTSADREVAYQRDELCQLLTPSEAAQFGSRNPRPGNSFTTGSEQCQWNGDMSITIDFALDASGVEATEGTTSDIEVAGLPAVQTQTKLETGLCTVRVTLNEERSAMTIGASVLTSGRGKGYQQCDVAKEVAEIVFPKVKG
jgi:hypothetical protein